jgi:hypothetical protein
MKSMTGTKHLQVQYAIIVAIAGSVVPAIEPPLPPFLALM